VKQLVLMTLLVNVFVPIGLSGEGSGAGTAWALTWFIVKLLALSLVVVLVETTNAKLRLFRVPDLLSAAFVLAALALMSTFLFR
jgi:formate hydrogenlyase subunit 4